MALTCVRKVVVGLVLRLSCIDGAWMMDDVMTCSGMDWSSATCISLAQSTLRKGCHYPRGTSEPKVDALCTDNGSTSPELCDSMADPIEMRKLDKWLS